MCSQEGEAGLLGIHSRKPSVSLAPEDLEMLPEVYSPRFPCQWAGLWVNELIRDACLESSPFSREKLFSPKELLVPFPT